MTRQYLVQIDTLGRMVDNPSERIEEAMAPFLTACEALTTVPGVSTNLLA